MRMKIMHAITSAKRSKLELCLRPTCKAFPPLGRGIASGVWLERRAELEEAKNIGHTVEIVKVC